jgi:hypothetical protein
LIQAKRGIGDVSAHCRSIPAPKEVSNGGWVLRTTYYARASATKGTPLLSSGGSKILQDLPPEMQRFSTKEAAVAAAGAFQKYLNNPTRKAARRSTAADAATPIQPCPSTAPVTQKRRIG